MYELSVFGVTNTLSAAFSSRGAMWMANLGKEQITDLLTLGADVSDPDVLEISPALRTLTLHCAQQLAWKLNVVKPKFLVVSVSA